MFKVYISKSKRGNIDDLMLLRKMLSKYEVEILEFTGGEYTPSKLDDADALILIPPNSDTDTYGKGQYEEARRFLENNIVEDFFIFDAELKEFCIISDQDNYKNHFYQIEGNWTTDWGTISYDSTIQINEIANDYSWEEKDQWAENKAITDIFGRTGFDGIDWGTVKEGTKITIPEFMQQ